MSIQELGLRHVEYVQTSTQWGVGVLKLTYQDGHISLEVMRDGTRRTILRGPINGTTHDSTRPNLLFVAFDCGNFEYTAEHWKIMDRDAMRRSPKSEFICRPLNYHDALAFSKNVEKTAQKYWSRVSRTFPNETYLSRIRLQFTEVNIISPNEFESIVPDQNGSLGYLDLIPTPPSLELHCCLRSPNRNERKVAFGVDNRQLLGQDVRILIADSQALQFTLQAGHAVMTLGPGQQTFQDSALDMIQRQDLCLRLKGESDEVVRQLVNAFDAMWAKANPGKQRLKVAFRGVQTPKRPANDRSTSPRARKQTLDANERRRQTVQTDLPSSDWGAGPSGNRQSIPRARVASGGRASLRMPRQQGGGIAFGTSPPTLDHDTTPTPRGRAEAQPTPRQPFSTPSEPRRFSFTQRIPARPTPTPQTRQQGFGALETPLAPHYREESEAPSFAYNPEQPAHQETPSVPQYGLNENSTPQTPILRQESEAPSFAYNPEQPAHQGSRFMDNPRSNDNLHGYNPGVQHTPIPQVPQSAPGPPRFASYKVNFSALDSESMTKVQFKQMALEGFQERNITGPIADKLLIDLLANITPLWDDLVNRAMEACEQERRNNPLPPTPGQPSTFRAGTLGFEQQGPGHQHQGNGFNQPAPNTYQQGQNCNQDAPRYQQGPSNQNTQYPQQGQGYSQNDPNPNQQGQNFNQQVPSSYTQGQNVNQQGSMQAGNNFNPQAPSSYQQGQNFNQNGQDPNYQAQNFNYQGSHPQGQNTTQQSSYQQGYNPNQQIDRYHGGQWHGQGGPAGPGQPQNVYYNSNREANNTTNNVNYGNTYGVPGAKVNNGLDLSTSITFNNFGSYGQPMMPHAMDPMMNMYGYPHPAHHMGMPGMIGGAPRMPMLTNGPNPGFSIAGLLGGAPTSGNPAMASSPNADNLAMAALGNILHGSAAIAEPAESRGPGIKLNGVTIRSGGTLSPNLLTGSVSVAVVIHRMQHNLWIEGLHIHSDLRLVTRSFDGCSVTNHEPDGIRILVAGCSIRDLNGPNNPHENTLCITGTGSQGEITAFVSEFDRASAGGRIIE